jgi:phospholipid/cholesterol/gamma-HCH transport system substrate-binding protein
MQRNAIEPILGALVLVAAVAFLVFAYNKAGQRDVNGYPLKANFSAIDGLQLGSDVRIGGVKVGEVTHIGIDPETYLAQVQLTVEHELKIPVDSVASVSTDGLLGGKFLGLLPGSSDTMLKPGGRIAQTQASVSLESMLGQFIYSSQGSGDKNSDKTAAPAAAQTATPAPPAGAPAQAAPAHP